MQLIEMVHGQPLNDYEQEREKRIAANRQKMAELGLLEASAQWTSRSSAGRGTRHSFVGADKGPRLKRAKTTSTRPPTRRSSRLASGNAGGTEGHPATRGGAVTEMKSSGNDEDEESENRALGFTRKGTPRKPVVLPTDCTAIVAPFSLRSIGTTVWELGTLYRGPWSKRYWSSAGCLYHHAYPLGYRATKIQFGKTYEMRIQNGLTGPNFEVTDTESGEKFVGASPTNPWTEVCLSLRTGQRISGPLYFGFSDPVTQAAIASNLYNEATLQAAISGRVPEPSPEKLSPEELAAREFMEIEGIGESVAMTIALTCQLGNQRHRCLQSLCEWVQKSSNNAISLREFLLDNEEIPASIRRWPAWKARIVDQILNGVLCWGKREAAGK